MPPSALDISTARLVKVRPAYRVAEKQVPNRGSSSMEAPEQLRLKLLYKVNDEKSESIATQFTTFESA